MFAMLSSVREAGYVRCAGRYLSSTMPCCYVIAEKIERSRFSVRLRRRLWRGEWRSWRDVRMRVRVTRPDGETGAASFHNSGWLDTFAGGLEAESVWGERQVENRRWTSRERDAEELQLTLRQGARRSLAKNLGQRGPRTLEEVSKLSRRFILY